MTRSSLYFRIINIFLEKNILIYINFVLVIFVLTSLSYDYEVVALDETIIDKFQNRSSEKFIQSNDSIIINYPNSNITNLTNNKEDSIYGQIAAFENDVYVVWQESVIESFPEHNYDIFFIKSEEDGNTFSKPINLSNNPGFSEHPQIAVSKNGVFIVWADNTNSNNTEIMFTKSEDNGTTFSKVINLSNNSQNSNNQEISAFDENVYVVWQDIDSTTNFYGNEINEAAEKKPLTKIMFKASLDTGKTFKDSIELANNTNDAYPKVNSYKEHVYVTWNSENSNSSSENDDDDNENSGLFFIKSSNKGNNFENSIRIAHYNFGESQISVNENKVFIVWGGLHAKNIKDIYFVQSDDNGTTFTDPYIISEKSTGAAAENRNDTDKINSPSNVEISTNNPTYIVWQEKMSQENQDIFIATNIKNDMQYSKIINLSNNSGISECPSIAISKNYVYVVWEDITPGNHEILFTRGTVS